MNERNRPERPGTPALTVVILESPRRLSDTIGSTGSPPSVLPAAAAPASTLKRRVQQVVLRGMPIGWLAKGVIRLLAHRVPADHREWFLTTVGEENESLEADKMARLRHLVGLRRYLHNYLYETVQPDNLLDDQFDEE